MAYLNTRAASRKRIRLSDESLAGHQGDLLDHSEVFSDAKPPSSELYHESNAASFQQPKSAVTASDDMPAKRQVARDCQSAGEKIQTDTKDVNEDSTAAASVWDTTELLEHIISYLPGKDVVVVSGVNKMSYNCAANSSVAQSKLFLHPSGHTKEIWEYCEFTRASIELTTYERKRIEIRSFEPSTEAYEKKCLQWRMEQPKLVWSQSIPVSVVDLCPLFELEDSKEETAIERLKRKGWREERANMIRLPVENTKYADMILTDPPTFEVSVELTYKHSLYPRSTIRATRRVTSSGSPLTIGMVLSDARSRTEPLFVDCQATATNSSYHFIGHGSIDAMIVRKVQEYGGEFALDVTKSHFVFQNRRTDSEFDVNHIIIPSAEERLEMEAKRAQ